MPRPDIHDIRNQHLAETLVDALVAAPLPRNYDLAVEQVRGIIEGHLMSMGLCLLDEQGD